MIVLYILSMLKFAFYHFYALYIIIIIIVIIIEALSENMNSVHCASRRKLLYLVLRDNSNFVLLLLFIKYNYYLSYICIA